MKFIHPLPATEEVIVPFCFSLSSFIPHMPLIFTNSSVNLTVRVGLETLTLSTCGGQVDGSRGCQAQRVLSSNQTFEIAFACLPRVWCCIPSCLSPPTLRCSVRLSMRLQWSASTLTHLLTNIWNEAWRPQLPFRVADSAKSGEWYAPTMLSKCVQFNGLPALLVVELPATTVSA